MTIEKLFTAIQLQKPVVEWVKTDSLKCMSIVEEHMNAKRSSEALQALSDTEEAIEYDFYYKNPRFFSYNMLMSMTRAYRSDIYMSSGIEDFRSSAVDWATRGFISECWTWIWEAESSNLSVREIIKKNMCDTTSSMQLLRDAMKNFGYELSSRDNDVILSDANIDIVMAGFIYSMIDFYSKARKNAPLTVLKHDLGILSRVVREFFEEDDSKDMLDIRDALLNEYIPHLISGREAAITTDEALEMAKSAIDYVYLPDCDEFKPAKLGENGILDYLIFSTQPYMLPEYRYKHDYFRHAKALKATEERVKAIQKENSQLKEEMRIVNNENKQLMKELNLAKSENDALVAKASRFEQKLDGLAREKDDLSKNVGAFKKSKTTEKKHKDKALSKISAQLEQCRSELQDMTTQKDDYVKKYQDAVTDNIALREKLSAVSEELRRHEREKRAAEKLSEVIEPTVTIDNDTKETIETDCFADSELRFAIIGGSESWRSAMLARHPKFKDIGNSKGFDAGKLDAVDILIINTQATSHAVTNKAQTNAPKDAVVILNSFNNVDLVDQVIKSRIGMS